MKYKDIQLHQLVTFFHKAKPKKKEPWVMGMHVLKNAIEQINQWITAISRKTNMAMKSRAQKFKSLESGIQILRGKQTATQKCVF